MSLFRTYVIDKDLTNKEIIEIEYVDTDLDDDEPFADTLSPKTKKVISKYFDFVRSNYEVVLEENPKFEIDDNEFYEKLIELYSVVNVKFKLYSERNKTLLLDMTEYILNNPEETNEKILDKY